MIWVYCLFPCTSARADGLGPAVVTALGARLPSLCQLRTHWQGWNREASLQASWGWKSQKTRPLLTCGADYPGMALFLIIIILHLWYLAVLQRKLFPMAPFREKVQAPVSAALPQMARHPRGDLAATVSAQAYGGKAVLEAPALSCEAGCSPSAGHAPSLQTASDTATPARQMIAAAACLLHRRRLRSPRAPNRVTAPGRASPTLATGREGMGRRFCCRF